MSSLNWIAQEVSDLRKDGLFRELDDGSLRESIASAARSLGVPFVDASSNDYLGMATWDGGQVVDVGTECALEPGIRAWKGPGVSRETPGATGTEEVALSQCSPGAAASRLLGGTRAIHVELERQLASWVHQSDALLFSSGYSANVGLISALASREDVIYSDSLNHASIVDGCRLSRARTRVFRHLDLDQLRSQMRVENGGGRRFVITESYFSMDGDSPDLAAMRSLCDEHGAALIVDEAHALGILGRRGAGLADAQGVRPDILVGTLGKAVGLHGAFVASSRQVKEWLWNRARSFVYSTAMAPCLARQLLFHVKHVQEADHLRGVLAARAAEIRRVAGAQGVSFPSGSHGPILPIIVGGCAAATQLSDSLRSNGILTYPVRPPTVPDGTSRIRLTVSAGTPEAAFGHLRNCVARCL